MASERTAADGGSAVARSITALLREAREVRGSDDETRREAFLAHKEQLLAQLARETHVPQHLDADTPGNPPLRVESAAVE